MRRSTRTTVKRLTPESDSEDDETTTKKFKPQIKNKKSLKISSSSSSSGDEDYAVTKKKSKNKKLNKSLASDNHISGNKENADSSSSESDIENYLQPADEIDFSSTFFSIQKPLEKKAFDSVETSIFDGINVGQLSDSESENEPEEPTASTSKADFHQLHEYTQRLEKAKEAVEKYEANRKALQASEKKEKRKKNQEEKLDISNLLAQGESKTNLCGELQTSVYSSDYETLSDSEKEDWQEIENNKTQPQESIVPKEGVQVTVQLPGVTAKKKKEIDALASIKRRLNRVRKENQVLVHKVHLLCWIAHGNFVNKVLNSENLMALALSLIPSHHCYPAARTDLSYLEQIVKWYRGTIPIVDKQYNQDMSLEHLLKLQLNLKKAYDKKMFVYIFICILRSLGIHCRLVLSFQVMPLRPPASELHSLSTKIDKSPDKAKTNNSKNEKESKEQHNNKDKSKTKSLNTNQDNKLTAKIAKSKENATKKVEVKKAESSSKSRKHLSPTSSNNKKEGSKTSEEKPKTRSRSTNEATNYKKSEEKSGNSKLKDAAKCLDKPKLHNLVKVPQVDGANDSEEEISSPQKTKPNLRKLSQRESVQCPDKRHKDSKSSFHEEDDSSNDFKPQSDKKKPNLKNLKEGQTPKKDLEQTTDDVTRKGSSRRSIATSSKIKESNQSSSERNEDNSKLTNDNKRILRSKGSTTNGESVKLCATKKERSKSSTTTNESVKSSTTKTGRSKSSTTANESVKSSATKTGRSKSSTTTNESVKSSTTKKERSSKKSSKSLETPKRSSLIRINYDSKSSNRLDVRNDIISIMKGRIAQERETERTKKVKKKKSRYSSDEDSDYVPIETKKKYDSDDEHYKETKVKVKQRVKPRKELEAMEEVKNKKGIDFWVEVYLEAEEKWIAADLIKGGIHCVSQIYARASHPVTYIVAWNNDSTIKDISQRYCPNWNTVTRTLRIDKKWWDETLKPFMGSKTARDKEEDEELALFHLEKPLPTTISEYKNHPLYALKRHLLKYQVFYPSNPVTLGFVRGEPVYSRECVKTVCSREKWYKEAKVVKQGEQPYKIVTRTTYDKYSKKFLQNQPLEVFGEWQVEDYVPPAAENGIVPKNEYGNVEIFKECMIPKGTVHLQLPGLNKIARKMNIDCPAAMVGFDVHHGWTHPMFDGFIVCEEHVETLIAAWHLDREEQEEKEKEKLEKRVYDNWKKLIKGLLIRERLKKRYNFGESQEPEGGKGKKRKVTKAPKFTCKKKKLSNETDSDSKA